MRDSIKWGEGFIRIDDDGIDRVSLPVLFNEFMNLPEEERLFLQEQYEMMVHRGEE